MVKGDAITLTCDVDDLGRPEADRFVWMRGRHVVTHVSGHNWTIDPVTLQTKANISCVAVNVVGEGERDSIDVEVFGEWNGNGRRRAGAQRAKTVHPRQGADQIFSSDHPIAEATNFNLGSIGLQRDNCHWTENGISYLPY